MRSAVTNTLVNNNPGIDVDLTLGREALLWDVRLLSVVFKAPASARASNTQLNMPQNGQRLCETRKTSSGA
jgi:hypothetical protein